MDNAETQTIDMNQAPAAGPTVVPPTPVMEFTGEPGNFTNDMAALAAAENASPAVEVPSVPVVEQPEITDAATAPVTVPDKFKDEAGNLDKSKVEKSLMSAEETLAKYLAKEAEMRQKMNDVSRLQQQAINPNIAPVAPTANQVPLTAFEIQVANDLINEAAAYGYQMPQGQAIAQARVQVKMAEARHNAEASLTETLRVKLEDQDRRSELELIAKHDSSVLTPEGYEALSKIRESKPWINQSPTPWVEAHKYYLAEQVLKARQTGTVLPTPKGLTAQVPPTPVGPAPRAVVKPKGPDLTSQAEVLSHVKTLTPEAEEAFWKSKGLRFP